MSQDGWMWQGRQEHGWFGHGTKPQNGPAGGGGRGGMYGSAPAALDERIRALGHAAIAGLPASKRYHPAASFDGPALERLVGSMRAWVGGLGLDHATFAARLFDRHPSSPVVGHLRRAAEIVAGATTSAEMRQATDALVAAMLAVGLDGWPRALKDAHERAQAFEASAPLLQQVKSTVRQSYPVPINPFGVIVPGTPENEAWTRSAGRAIGAARRAIEQVFTSQSQNGERQPDKATATGAPKTRSLGTDAAAGATPPEDPKEKQSERTGKDADPDDEARLTDAQRSALKRLNNIIRDHAKERDFEGVVKEREGIDTGYDHITEMEESLEGLRKFIESLRGSLKNPNLQPSVRRQLEEALQRGQDVFERMQRALSGNRS